MVRIRQTAEVGMGSLDAHMTTDPLTAEAEVGTRMLEVTAAREASPAAIASR